MSDDVVRLAHELASLKAADRHEIGVAIGDATFEVGHRYQRLVCRELIRVLANWSIDSHGRPAPLLLNQRNHPVCEPPMDTPLPIFRWM